MGKINLTSKRRNKWTKSCRTTKAFCPSSTFKTRNDFFFLQILFILSWIYSIILFHCKAFLWSFKRVKPWKDLRTFLELYSCFFSIFLFQKFPFLDKYWRRTFLNLNQKVTKIVRFRFIYIRRIFFYQNFLKNSENFQISGKKSRTAYWLIL